MSLLDSIEPKQRNFPLAFFAGAICGLRKYGPAALDILNKFNRDFGVKDGEKADAAFMLRQFLEEERNKGTLPGAKNNTRQLQMTLAYIKRGVAGGFYKNEPSPVDLQSFF